MTAQIFTFADGRSAFTRRAGTEAAWHRLGGETPAGAPPEQWARDAGMDFSIESSPVTFGDGQVFAGRRVLYRDDTRAPLGIVSDRYKVVQPIEVLEFFRDLTLAGGYQLETAGVLGEGGKYWALATNGMSADLGGDIIKPYLLLATACDGSLATTAQFTSVRVVCQNTLTMATAGAVDAIKVRHSTRFDAAAVKRDLGIDQTFDAFIATADRMASTSIASRDAAKTIWDLFVDDASAKPADLPKQTRDKIESVWTLFNGSGKGADLPSSRGTVWGLLNAVTEYVDHQTRARSDENRLSSAWFGQGKALKDRAFEMLTARAA